MKATLSSRARWKLRPDDFAWFGREAASDVPRMVNRHHRPDHLAYNIPPGAEDKRAIYLLHYLDVRDRNVLELGPAYGHFTVMLDKLGAARIIAVEGRAENIEACERIKRIYHLDSTTFIQHDIDQLCSGAEEPSVDLSSDVIFNAGVFYHLADPMAAARWCRRQAPEMLLMTQYFEPRAPRYYRSDAFRETTLQLDGRTVSALSFDEGGAVHPLSGLAHVSTWLQEGDLVALLKESGYRRVDTLSRDLLNGLPHISLLASAD